MAVKRVLVYIYKWRRFAPPDKHTKKCVLVNKRTHFFFNIPLVSKVRDYRCAFFILNQNHNQVVIDIYLALLKQYSIILSLFDKFVFL